MVMCFWQASSECIACAQVCAPVHSPGTLPAHLYFHWDWDESWIPYTLHLQIGVRGLYAFVYICMHFVIKIMAIHSDEYLCCVCCLRSPTHPYTMDSKRVGDYKRGLYIYIYIYKENIPNMQI